MPRPVNVRVDQLLTNVSIAYAQSAEAFVADKVFPIVPVDVKSGFYVEYPKEDWFRVEAEERAPGTESAGSGFNIETTREYFCRVYAVHKDLDDQIMADQLPPVNLERDATRWVTNQLLLRREIVWAERFFRATSWGTVRTGVAATPGAGQFLQWDNANSDPIADIKQAKREILEKTGFEPNTLVVDQYTHDALTEHPLILDRIKYFGGGAERPAVVTKDILAALFEIDRYLVSKAVINTAPQGVAGTFQFVSPKAALLCYAAPEPGILTPSAGYIFSWDRYLGGKNAYAPTIKRIRIETRESDRIEGSLAFDARKVADDLAIFFDQTVA